MKRLVRLLPVMVWLAVLAVSGWLLVFHTAVTTDLSNFLPRSATPAEQLLVRQLREGAASRLILIGIEGAPSSKLADLSRSVALRLAQDKRFSRVQNGSQGLSPAEQAFLFNHRYLLSPGVTSGAFTSEALHRDLEQRLADLASPLGMLEKSTLARDPTGEFRRVLQPWLAAKGPGLQDGVWFSPDGRRALLVAETAAAGFDAERQQMAVDAIRQAFAAADPGDARLVLSGPGVFAAASRSAIEADSQRLTLIALILVLGILLAVYRSAIPVLLAMVPVLTGLAVGVAAVGLVFGQVHGITLGFGATLIGEAVDYPSYLFTHVAPGETVRDTLRRIWPTLRLAVATTVFGAFAMLLSSFEGLSQLGLLSIVGVLTAGLTTRWVLPAMAPIRMGAAKAQRLPLGLARCLRRAQGRGWVAWGFAAAAVAVLMAYHGRIWDNDLENMSPVPAALKSLDQRLRADLGAPDVRYLLVGRGATADQALERSAAAVPLLQALAEKKIIAGFDLAASYLPSQAVQQARRAALPSEPELRAALDKAMKGTPFRMGVFSPFVTDMERARQSRLLTPADFAGTVLGLKLQSLLFQDGDQWVALAPLRGVADGKALAAEVAARGPAGVFLLDMKSESNRMVNGYRNESLRLIGAGMAIIAVLLAWGLKGAAPAVRVMAPVLMAVVATTAAILLLGERLSIFHLVALLLVVGIGLNYALFFNRGDCPPDEWRRTELALAVCSLTTLSAFGALAFSVTPVLHAIGLTVSLGAVFSLLFSLILSNGRPLEGGEG